MKFRAKIRVPGPYVEKYFGKKSLSLESARKKRRTQRFLAKQLAIEPSEIQIDETGDIFVPREGYNRLLDVPLEDRSFIENGGKGAAVYEGVEMAFNDVMSGAVEASKGKLLEPVHHLASAIKQKLPDSVRRFGTTLARHGAIGILTGAGAGAAAGLGLYLAFRGARELKQGVAREDLNQVFSGGRHIGLGAEAVLTGATLASKISTNALIKTAASVAQKAATPFAFLHGVIDLSQGVYQLKKAVSEKDALAAAEGLAELGMGAGWMAAALGPTTPAVVTIACVALATRLTISVVKSRRDKRRAGEMRALELSSLHAPVSQSERTELVIEEPLFENPLEEILDRAGLSLPTR